MRVIDYCCDNLSVFIEHLCICGRRTRKIWLIVADAPENWLNLFSGIHSIISLNFISRQWYAAFNIALALDCANDHNKNYSFHIVHIQFGVFFSGTLWTSSFKFIQFMKKKNSLRFRKKKRKRRQASHYERKRHLSSGDCHTQKRCAFSPHILRCWPVIVNFLRRRNLFAFKSVHIHTFVDNK